MNSLGEAIVGRIHHVHHGEECFRFSCGRRGLPSRSRSTAPTRRPALSDGRRRERAGAVGFAECSCAADAPLAIANLILNFCNFCTGSLGSSIGPPARS